MGLVCRKKMELIQDNQYNTAKNGLMYMIIVNIISQCIKRTQTNGYDGGSYVRRRVDLGDSEEYVRFRLDTLDGIFDCWLWD